MFAFAVWDERDRTLFLARDRMGQKPLYVAVPRSPGGAAIAFASDVGSLRQLGWFVGHLDERGVADYLRYGYTSGADPPFDGYRQLGAGCHAVVACGTGPTVAVDDRPYFEPNQPAPPPRPADPVAATRTLVRQAVERQLVSDVPLGVFLSGGMDSSVIAAAARRSGPVRTFGIGFDDPRYDESGHAAAVAAHLGCEHHTFRVTPDAVADLPALAAAFGEPFGDSSALPTHYLSRETRRHVTVALSGDGGDELFGGYDRYRAMRLGRRLGPWVLRPAVWWGRVARLGHPKSRLTRLGRLLASLGDAEAERYDGYVRLFDERSLAALWPATHRRRGLAAQYELLRLGGDEVQAALALDRVTYLPGDLLTKTDRCSMLHGLEVRSPFMDPDVVTFAAGLTTDELLKGGPKRMLREAFADDLPAWVFRRKKMGFAVPVGDWFRGPLRAMLRDTLFAAGAFGRAHFDMAVVERLVADHESRRADHGQRLYALLMLELWWASVGTLAAGW